VCEALHVPLPLAFGNGPNARGSVVPVENAHVGILSADIGECLLLPSRDCPLALVPQVLQR
jgi:hypothetical protein